MKIEIKYSKHFDLIFHVLAYLKVNNASNLYSEEYISRMGMEKQKQNFEYDIILNVNLLQEYYNDNFERLTLINFLPFYSNSFKEMKDIFVSCTRFTSADFQYFINPFIEILDKESVFYFDYWDKLHKLNERLRYFTEKNISNEIEKYSCIFDYYNTSAMMILSYSITHNGRGFNGIDSYFSALVPLPVSADYTKYTFFSLLHEYTHQFTDNLLKVNINMSDGSHDVSENIVILADYYLIKSIATEDVPIYFNWLIQISGNTDIEIDEDGFLSMFRIDEHTHTDLKKLIDNITGNNKLQE